jgi:hypothetical protein
MLSLLVFLLPRNAELMGVGWRIPTLSLLHTRHVAISWIHLSAEVVPE